MSEYCIMPESPLYSTERRYGLERHEVFFGSLYRKQSIEDGLVVFLTAEQHRGTVGVHGRDGHKFDLTLKQIGQRTAMKYYGWSVQEFIKRYGKNYI